MLVIWSWTYFYNLHWNSYLYFKGLLYIWEEMIMMALLHMAGLGLPWSKKEEGAYIFWMKQVPVVYYPLSILMVDTTSIAQSR
jgi:hypothetical protein